MFPFHFDYYIKFVLYQITIFIPSPTHWHPTGNHRCNPTHLQVGIQTTSRLSKVPERTHFPLPDLHNPLEVIVRSRWSNACDLTHPRVLIQLTGATIENGCGQLWVTSELPSLPLDLNIDHLVAMLANHGNSQGHRNCKWYPNRGESLSSTMSGIFFKSRGRRQPPHRRVQTPQLFFEY